MATPMVSGAVALLLEQSPNMTPDQVKARLMRTATKDFPQETTVTNSETDEAFTSEYNILLPFSEDGETVSQILVYSIARSAAQDS